MWLSAETPVQQEAKETKNNKKTGKKFTEAIYSEMQVPNTF